MFKILFSWPDELPSDSKSLDPLSRAAIYIRLENYLLAESLLISELCLSKKSNLPTPADKIFLIYFLFFWLYRSQKYKSQSAHAFQCLSNYADNSCSDLHRLIKYIYWLDTDNFQSLGELSDEDWILKDSPIPSYLYFSEYLIRIGNFSKAKVFLDSVTGWWQYTFECLRLRSDYFIYIQDWDQALQIDLNSVKRFSCNIECQRHLLYTTLQARSHEHTLPSLRYALKCHGDHSIFLSHLCRICLLQFRSADARQYCLRDRVFKLTAYPFSKPFITNLWVIQERLGNSDWLEYFDIDSISIDSFHFSMLEPLMSQIASLYGFTALSKKILNPILASFRTYNHALTPSIFPNTKADLSSRSENLTVAWISSDVCYHPVARFLYGYFSSAKNLSHRHILVDVNDHGSESFRSHFDSLSTLEVVNLGRGDINRQIEDIRSLSPDIAIDLNGWTGSNILRGFYAGLAPLQVNYLGYFASTGLKQIDYWLGDSSLFPQSFPDYHSEALYRLNRCFIAWQPSEPLPEASVDVVSSSSPASVAFGSFNHNRKLSNATLSLWSKILTANPGSTLVLKASNQDDPSTQELLRRRMVRNGLDTARVTWLPRTATPEEHLHQYSLIDIALDCFPNGGCTTTCEALWMGVPVITLSASTYAGRMSTAVLAGAGLHTLCANTQQEYFNLANQQASNVTWLRQNREFWRKSLLCNPLGRADLLMRDLEIAFSHMSTNS